jgi:pteridine reductase
MELTGKTAIITGAGGQLGSQIVLALARRGLNCLCHYNTSALRAEQVVKGVEKLGRSAALYQADLSKPGFAAEIFKQAARLGPVRVIVNSASVFTRQPLGTFSDTEIADMLAVNLAAPISICSAFADYLLNEGADWKTAEDPFAAIINMTDVAGIRPWAGFAPYCASRAGLIAVTESLAKELAPGVTVNAIAPGIVTWPGKMDPTDEQNQLAKIPARRFGSPEDITRAVNYLLDSPYVTGQTLTIDGGRSI